MCSKEYQRSDVRGQRSEIRSQNHRSRRTDYILNHKDTKVTKEDLFCRIVECRLILKSSVTRSDKKVFLAYLAS